MWDCARTVGGLGLSHAELTDLYRGERHPEEREGFDDDPAEPRTIQGSLRQFADNSNAIDGAATSAFRLNPLDPGYDGTGNGEFTFALDSALPDLEDTVICAECGAAFRTDDGRENT